MYFPEGRPMCPAVWVPALDVFAGGTFKDSKRIGRAAGTNVRIQIQCTVIPIRRTRTAVRRIVPITAEDRTTRDT